MPKSSLLKEQLKQMGLDENQEKKERADYGSFGQAVQNNPHFNLVTNAAVKPEKSEKEKEELEETIMMTDEMKRQLKKIRHQKTMERVTKVTQIVFAIGCVYLIYLIYGVLNTNYIYDAKGNVSPKVLTVENIKEINEFEIMNSQYLQARTLYEKVLVLDYRIALAYEDPLIIAPDYEKLLESVSTLAVQIGGLTVPAQYTQPMNMLLSWVQNDLALYCQYVSRAITQNSMGDMEQALKYKDIMYNNFKQITQVVATLGTNVDGANITEIISWTPENYIASYIGG